MNACKLLAPDSQKHSNIRKKPNQDDIRSAKRHQEKPRTAEEEEFCTCIKTCLRRGHSFKSVLWEVTSQSVKGVKGEVTEAQDRFRER